MALTKMELAKAKLALHAGFFISLTSKLQFIEDTRIETAYTDGRRIGYNPAFIDTLNLKQTIGLVLHEVGHNMLSHPARMAHRNPHIANIAMDIVLNQLLQKYFDETRQTLDAELPPGGIFGSQYAKYEGKNWEWVYDDLMKNVTKIKIPQFDTVLEATGPGGRPLTPKEAEVLAKEWAMAVQQAATMAKSRGKLPGFMEQFIADMVSPKVDWRAQVREIFSKVAKEDISWRRFNRRYVYQNQYLPGRYSEHLNLVDLYVDTSGSMGSEEFKLAMGTLNDILEDLKPERIMFGQCDTRMCSEEMLTSDDVPLVPRKFKGRGGTELTPMFEHLAQQEEEPDLMVVVTDGYFSAIPKALEPNCPVCWLITTDSTEAAEQSFGRVIKVTV